MDTLEKLEEMNHEQRELREKLHKLCREFLKRRHPEIKEEKKEAFKVLIETAFDMMSVIIVCGERDSLVIYNVHVNAVNDLFNCDDEFLTGLNDCFNDSLELIKKYGLSK